MTPLALALLIGQVGSSQGGALYRSQLTGVDGTPGRMETYFKDAPLDSPKLSPKKFAPLDEPYAFDWALAGFVKDKEELRIRFRLYPQTKPDYKGDITFSTLRALLRCWEIANAWGLDHPAAVPYQVVDVYLCWGGVAGGEQLFDHDPQVPRGDNDLVNTVYIYDLPSFEGPVEQLREVAHEYGHAILPAIGGYQAPENWANGMIGERLFLRKLLALRKADKVPAGDAFGVSTEELGKWVAAKVDAPMNLVAAEGPEGPSLKRRDAVGMERLAGLVAYLEAILPPKSFGRTLKLLESTRPEAFVKAAALAVSEPETATLHVPTALRGSTIWIPLGTAKVSGASVVERSNGWAKIKVGAVDPVLANPRP